MQVSLGCTVAHQEEITDVRRRRTLILRRRQGAQALLGFPRNTMFAGSQVVQRRSKRRQEPKSMPEREVKAEVVKKARSILK